MTLHLTWPPVLICLPSALFGEPAFSLWSYWVGWEGSDKGGSRQAEGGVTLASSRLGQLCGNKGSSPVAAWGDVVIMVSEVFFCGVQQ